MERIVIPARRRVVCLAEEPRIVWLGGGGHYSRGAGGSVPSWSDRCARGVVCELAESRSGGAQ